MNRWAPQGPPAEAYSRVTNPERFRSLHDFALTVMTEVHASFDVERQDGFGFDSELEFGELARPSARLVPTDSKAAPLVVVFTRFPGLKVRAGRWCTAAFPACGCDACDETARDEAIRLSAMIDDVVAGRFREGISIPLAGDAWHEWELGSPPYGSSGRVQVDREHIRATRAGIEPTTIEWVPWTRRGGSLA